MSYLIVITVLHDLDHLPVILPVLLNPLGLHIKNHSLSLFLDNKKITKGVI